MSQIRTLADSAAFQALGAAVSKATAGRSAIFVINDGNWGDSLIREGAERFLKDHGIRYIPVRYKDLEKRKVSVAQLKAKAGGDAVMIFNGGAAMDPRYGRIEFVAGLTRQFSESILLPASYPAPVVDFDFAPRTKFFTRDRAESSRNVPQAEFCHDMAFYLRLPDTRPSRDIGVFMRTDGERPADAPVPAGNVDLSLKGRAETPVGRFVQEIARYRTIYTNRLHVGICAALLGREVRLFGNDYFKIRAIYEASIRDNFDNVIFSTDVEIPLMQKRRWWQTLPGLRR